MDNVQDLIARHAYITAGMQRARAVGAQIPRHIIEEHQRIEARAQASFTPHELSQAQAASQSMQAQYLQQADFAKAQSDARDLGYHTEKLSKDLTGMTYDQALAAKAGQPIPVKGSERTPYKDNLAKMLKSQGVDMSYDQFLKVADRVEELKGAGKSPASYLQGKFKDKAQAVSDLVGGFHHSGVGIELGIRGEDTPDHYVKPTDELQRRTQIADSFARSATNDKEGADFIRTGLDPSYLESDTSQGDVARAFAHHEAEETREERLNYESPSYELTDSSDEELPYVSSF